MEEMVELMMSLNPMQQKAMSEFAGREIKRVKIELKEKGAPVIRRLRKNDNLTVDECYKLYTSLDDPIEHADYSHPKCTPERILSYIKTQFLYEEASGFNRGALNDMHVYAAKDAVDNLISTKKCSEDEAYELIKRHLGEKFSTVVRESIARACSSDSDGEECEDEQE
jgi:predicted HTH domain antitoxin